MRDFGKGDGRHRAVVALLIVIVATAAGGLVLPSWALLCWSVSIVLAATAALLVVTKEDS